ncbi:MAG: RDD family protein [Planctomycetota bacterium]
MNIENQNPFEAPQSIDQATTSQKLKGVNSPYASRWKRFIGQSIDNILQGISLVPIIVVAIWYSPELLNEDSYLTELLISLIVLPYLLVSFTLMNFYLLQTRGQTVGKYLMNTQILSNNDELVPVFKIITVRYFLTWTLGSIPAFGNFFNLLNALAIFRENHKCIHDEICKTKVVEYRELHPIKS